MFTLLCFLFKQKTAYEMRISDWSSDVCSSDLYELPGRLDGQPIFSGLANVDENGLEDPQGRYLATSLRLFDRPTGSWAIYWIDGRFPTIDPPVVGRDRKSVV